MLRRDEAAAVLPVLWRVDPALARDDARPHDDARFTRLSRPSFGGVTSSVSSELAPPKLSLEATEPLPRAAGEALIFV
ncbi:hypothetical protein OAO87_01210 [bacterium]|nr:hypothetical protein [bacterium]